MNSDLFTDANFEELYNKVLEEHAVMGISSNPYTITVPYAILDLEGDEIKSFIEKPNNTYYASAGIYIFKQNLINRIPKNHFFNITDLIDLLIAENQKVVHCPIIGYWIDIGKIQDFNYANEIVKHLNSNN
jgi:NDP-sugar pyrophosphorylase family protein